MGARGVLDAAIARRLFGSLAAFFAMVFTARVLLRALRWPFQALVWEPGRVAIYAILAVLLFAVAVRCEHRWKVVCGLSGLLFSAYCFALGDRLMVEARRWKTAEDVDVTSGYLASRGAALILALASGLLLYGDLRNRFRRPPA